MGKPVGDCGIDFEGNWRYQAVVSMALHVLYRLHFVRELGQAVLVIGGGKESSVAISLTELCREAKEARLAVSYLQVSGLESFSKMASGVPPAQVSIICTDQHGITDPRAVEKALDLGFKVRRYAGDRIFHSKVYLFRQARKSRFLIGSSNLSYPALYTSVEANIVGTDDGALSSWFDGLYKEQTEEFSAATLAAMRTRFGERMRAEIAGGSGRIATENERLETLDALLGNFDEEPALLNFDHAGNNVRSLAFALEVLGRSAWSSKQRSEMNLLGFATNGILNQLGRAASRARNERELAAIWTRWLFSEPTDKLALIGRTGRLPRAKRALANFWRLRRDVISYFLSHAEKPDSTTRTTLQTIELVANLGGPAEHLSLESIRKLTDMLQDTSTLPPVTREIVREYLNNKGVRGWDVPDRRLIPEAWRDASRQAR